MIGSVIRLIPGVGGEALESSQGWGLAMLHCLGSNSISEQKEQKQNSQNKNLVSKKCSI